MSKEMHIGFVGPYSTANLGDYAMLVNNIYDICAKNITVFSYSIKFPKLSLDTYCEEYNIKYVEPAFFDELGVTVNTENNNITPMELLSCISNTDVIAHEISKIDVLIVSGGGWLNHFWTERKDKLFKMITPLLIAKQQGKKIVFTANGIGPFDTSTEFYRYIFSYLGDISVAVRDKQFSPLYLNDLGVKENAVSHIPDDLYIINQKLLARPLTFRPKSKNYIVMEMFYPMEVLDKEINRIKNFAKAIKNKYDLDVVLLPYDLVFYGLDQARYLYKNIQGSELIDIEETGFLPVQDAYSIIKNAKFMLSSRYHGLVLSVAAKTPVIYRTLPTSGDMRYSYSKALGFIRTTFDGIDIDEHQFMAFDLISSLEQIEKNLPEIIDEQNKLFYSDLFNDNFEKLKNIRHEYIYNNIRKEN